MLRVLLTIVVRLAQIFAGLSGFIADFRSVQVIQDIISSIPYGVYTVGIVIAGSFAWNTHTRNKRLTEQLHTAEHGLSEVRTDLGAIEGLIKDIRGDVSEETEMDGLASINVARLVTNYVQTYLAHALHGGIAHDFKVSTAIYTSPPRFYLDGTASEPDENSLRQGLNQAAAWIRSLAEEDLTVPASSDYKNYRPTQAKRDALRKEALRVATLEELLQLPILGVASSRPRSSD